MIQRSISDGRRHANSGAWGAWWASRPPINCRRTATTLCCWSATATLRQARAGACRHDRAGPFLRLVFARAPMILLKSLILKDQALRFKFSADPRLYIWSWLFLMECTSEKARRNTLLKHRLAAYSQAILKQVVADEAIDYDRNDHGILYFHRSQQALDNGVKQMKLLESDGQAIELLDRDRVVALDPSLARPGTRSSGEYIARPTRPAIPQSSQELWRRRSPSAAALSIRAQPSQARHGRRRHCSGADGQGPSRATPMCWR